MNDELTIDGIRYRRMDRIADRVSTSVMFGCHLFDQLKATSVDALVAEWQANNADAEYTKEVGQAYLCPVIVLDDKKELRRVGTMVFPCSPSCASDLAAWVAACKADPDIERLLAARS